MLFHHRRLITLGLLACSAALAHAQDKTPLRILVGFAPGGSADVLARLVAEGLRDDFAPIVVDNKPGAGGRIALGMVKAAKPDGQTVIVLPSGPMVLFPHVYKKLDYDAVKDFTPVSQIATVTDASPVSRSHAAHESRRFAAWCHCREKLVSFGQPMG